MIKIFKKIVVIFPAFLLATATLPLPSHFQPIALNENETISILQADGVKRKPKILLFNCNFGAGHKMATQGIIESLPDCNVKVVDIYQETLRSLDPMGSLVPKLSHERIYNNMTKSEWNRCLNFLGTMTPGILQLQKKKIEQHLIECLIKEKPNLLISCIPLMNSFLLRATEKLNIPFLVVTTDIDISNFCYGLSKHPWSEKNLGKFWITVPFEKTIWEAKFGQRYSSQLKDHFCYGFGYPTRRSFSLPVQEKVLNDLRNEYGIKSNENVILVMMGGNTSHAALTYAKLLLSMSNQDINKIIGKNNPKQNIRLICLCGNINERENNSLMVKLNSLNHFRSKQNQRVHVHACAGTAKIAELVSLPELCTVISKPGGSTVNEMIKKKMPMIYHISDVLLDWEKGNMEYGELQKLGRRFQISRKRDSMGNRAELVKTLTYTFSLHKSISNLERKIPESEIDFTSHLRQTIKKML